MVFEGYEFDMLNQRYKVTPHRFPQPKHDLLWDYHFHYFDGLHSQAPRDKLKSDWLGTWMLHVPVGASPAWDPYPTSRRISNWIKWFLAIPGSASRAAVESLALQTRALEHRLEYHLLGNHLLANATALSMAGVYFGGAEGAAWLARGTSLLREELLEQFLDDGAHFELSPGYHALITEDLLDLIQAGRCTGVDLPDLLLAKASSALSWLKAIVRPDGHVPLFNDAAYDVTPPVDQLLEYGRRLGILPSSIHEGTGLQLLGPSGYFHYSHGRMHLVGDVGEVGPSYQPGHTHCDMLSFELCWDGRPVVVDTGTSTYAIGHRRNQERGTSAHNNVQLDDIEQSEIWAGFRVARRAKVESINVDDATLTATIKGFPPAWARLCRTWRFKGEALEIEDRILDARNVSRRKLTARLHFHPEVTLTGEGNRWEADGLEISFRGATAVRGVPYHYAPEFNSLSPARCLEVEFSGTLVTSMSP